MSLDNSAFAMAWNGLVRLSTAQQQSVAHELERLKRAYGQQHRVYHTLDHIEYCLQVWDEIALDMTWTLKQLSSMTLALVYHDAVYRPDRTDNEARSARWFAYRAHELGAKPNDIQFVSDLILATQKHQTETPLAMFVVDVDLSILAAELPMYERYCRQIRQEYAYLSDQAFQSGRGQFLRGMLARRQIFQSRYGLREFEAKARQNLSRELESLS